MNLAFILCFVIGVTYLKYLVEDRRHILSSVLLQDSGYEFTVNKEQKAFRGTTGYFSGDNLGAQLLGGFKEGSSSHRPCRECTGSNKEIKDHVRCKITNYQYLHVTFCNAT